MAMNDEWRDRAKAQFKKLKKERKITQEYISEKVGVTQGTIAHWFSGRRSPETLEQYEKLAVALELHPAELLFGVSPSGGDSQSERLYILFSSLDERSRAAILASAEALSK